MRQQAHVAIAAVVAALALVLPLAGSPALTELAAVSLIVLASALHAAPRPVALLLVQVVGRPVAGEPGPPVLSSRTTDPTHHPLAPRAPGLG